MPIFNVLVTQKFTKYLREDPNVLASEAVVVERVILDARNVVASDPNTAALKAGRRLVTDLDDEILGSATTKITAVG